jgi:hypothetical protein
VGQEGPDQTSVAQVLRTDTGEEVASFSLGHGWLLGPALSPDGRFVAWPVLATTTFQIRLFHAATGKPVADFRAAARPGFPHWTLIFSQDGRYLLGGDEEAEALLADLARGMAESIVTIESRLALARLRTKRAKP